MRFSSRTFRRTEVGVGNLWCACRWICGCHIFTLANVLLGASFSIPSDRELFIVPGAYNKQFGIVLMMSPGCPPAECNIYAGKVNEQINVVLSGERAATKGRAPRRSGCVPRGFYRCAANGSSRKSGSRCISRVRVTRVRRRHAPKSNLRPKYAVEGEARIKNNEEGRYGKMSKK